MSLIDDETRAILKRYGISPEQYRKGKIDPATGTTTDSSGPVRSDQDRSGAQGPAIDVADMAAKFEEEVDNAIADLGADNENADLSPAEVLRQAKKIAMQNLKAWAEAGGDGTDVANATASAANYRDSGDVAVANKLFD